MGEMQLTGKALYTARPTLRIDGQEQPEAERQLLSMRMHEQEGGLSSLEMEFGNVASREDGGAGPAFEDERVFRLGAEIKVYSGAVGGPTEIFGGRISALGLEVGPDGPPRLCLHAEDKLAAARLARRSEVYEQQAPADIARAIAGRHGLTPVIDGLDQPRGSWVQLNESDLGFLRRLLQRFAADVQVVGSELHVAPWMKVRRNEIELRLHSQLLSLRAMADLAQQATCVRVTGFDPEQGQAISADSATTDLGPGAGRKGHELLQQLFGERIEQLGWQLALTQEEAQQLADAQFAQRARGFTRVQGACEGNPALRVGSQLRIKDVSPRFDNLYYVTACSHRYDMKRGYETGFCAESAFLGNPA
ncbi:MAG TPA: contractile injection system protein, VgrG/Pvc8 family [Solimonas sp.]|nr:contractile injection system protein, VgrG/Pvc8 family [Solimonas sp.]